jgi:hypothetical protein
MLLSVDNIVPFPIADVFRGMRDQMPAIAEYLPNIDSIEILEQADPAENERTLVNRWNAAATEVPVMARKFIDPSSIYWIDHAHWFESDWHCDWRLEMGFMTERIKTSGKTSFHETPRGTEVRIRGELSLDLKGLVPGFVVKKATAGVESFVVKLLKPNFQKTNDALTRYLQAQQS